MLGLLYRLPRNVITIFSGRNILWHALAIVLTMVIVMSGSDWSYYLSTRGDTFFLLARPAIILGTLLPVPVTLALLMVGEFRKNPGIITAAWALGQAAILGFLISSCYKAFTGRIPPPFSRRFSMPATSNVSPIDTSHHFQFGFLKGGMFWGWPSSHTTVAFAMAACLITLYPGNKKLILFASLYAFYIGLGVSVTIHWFSEFVAGAIIGSVIGMVVGRSFKSKPA
ncbi:MAG: phosphatase PAP2 family protein [Verrucomicrobiota bacterium]|jgi:membrane-associated phospholipid phosphatase